MTLSLEVHPDPSAAARRVAGLIATRVHEGASTLAFSRGAELLARLGEANVEWSQSTVYQVDERIRPQGHEDRNLTQLFAALPTGVVCPMPVEERDLDAAAVRYGNELPESLDLVHLGLGADGHTASLVPDDPVLGIRDRLVAVTQEYEGHRRMTLTYPAFETAREIVWLVIGKAKREALARLLSGDLSIPAARISNPRQLVVADSEAAP